MLQETRMECNSREQKSKETCKEMIVEASKKWKKRRKYARICSKKSERDIAQRRCQAENEIKNRLKNAQNNSEELAKKLEEEALESKTKLKNQQLQE